jgi:O-antigen/teichoic acid export membrane protein
MSATESRDAAHHGREAHRQLWRDIIKYFPSVIIPRLTGIITVPIVTRLFPPAVFGNYALVMANVTILNSAILTGIGSCLLRFLPERTSDPRREGELLSTIFTLAIALSVIVSAVGLIGLHLLGPRIGMDSGNLMAVGFVLFATNGIFALVSLVLRSAGKAGLYSTIQLVSGYGGLAFGLLLVLVFHFGIRGLLIGNVLAGLLGISLAWPVAMRGKRVRPWALSKPVLREILGFAFFVSMGNAAYWLLSSSDRWLLRIFRGANDVGLYSASYDITGKTTQMGIIAFGLALQPLSISTWEGRGREATEHLLTDSTRTYVVVMLPAAIGLSLLARPLISLIATASYVGGARIIPFVALSMFLFGLLDIAGRGLTLSKRPDIEARNLLLAGVTNVSLNLLLIPRFGIMAAALSALCGYVVLLALHVASVRRYVTWRFPWASFARVSLACGVMALVVFALGWVLAPMRNLPRLLLLSAAGALTYALAIVGLREVSLSGVRELFSRPAR